MRNMAIDPANRSVIVENGGLKPLIKLTNTEEIEVIPAPTRFTD